MILALVPVIISFLVTLLFIPVWMRKATSLGLLWEDMNKLSAKPVVGSAGIIVVLSFLLSALLLIAYQNFYLGNETHTIEVLSLVLSVLFLGAVGFVDDLLGWQKGGLSILSRVVLVLIGAIPLMVINAGKSIISLPIIGHLDLGVAYPLIIIPLGLLGATTTFNILAGFNGLEAGQGILLLGASGLVAFLTGNVTLALIALIMAGGLIAFMVYNYFPARIFPGDVLTYATGGLIAGIAIVGNFEKIALCFYIPYFIEAFLKLRGGLQKHSFGKPMNDGSLTLRYDKLYSLNHIAIYLLHKTGVKPTERKAVALIWIFQVAVIAATLFVFREGIFV